MTNPALFAGGEYLRNVLQGRLPGISQGDCLITECQPLHLHYKTFLKQQSQAKSFLSGTYRLQVHNKATGNDASRIIFVKAFQGERSSTELLRVINQPLYPVSHGVPLIHLADPGVIVWAFPNDPVMHWLPEAINPQLVAKHLAAVLYPQRIDSLVEVTSTEAINYRPEIRCTTKYQLRCGVSAQAQKLRLYGKTYADDRGREIFARTEKLRQAGRHRPADFLIPRPMGYCPEIRTFWQEELPGVPLIEIINERNYRDLLKAVAQRLIFINHCELSAPPQLTPHEQLDEAKKKTAKLIHAFPQMQTSLGQIIGRLENLLPTLTRIPARIVHGDFHLRQLLVHQGSVALFDFDEFSYGDPAEDIGNFLADLHSYQFRPPFIEAMAQAFIETYARQSGLQIPPDCLTWHLSQQLLTRAYRAYLQQKPDLENTVRYFVELAAKQLSLCCGNAQRRTL